MLLQNRINLLHLLPRQPRHALQVLRDLIHRSSSRNGNDGGHILALTQRQNPRQRNLNGRDALARRQLLDRVHQLDVMLHVVVLEFDQVAPEIAFGELGFVAEGAGEDAPAERGVGDDGDVEVGAGFGDAVG